MNPLLYEIKVTEKNRFAKTVDEFFYPDVSLLKGKKGTGVRGLAARYVREGKIVFRNVSLEENGNTVIIITLFRDNKFLEEFENEEESIFSKEFFTGRDMVIERKKTQLNDYVMLS